MHAPLLYDETKYLGSSDRSHVLSSITGDLKPKIKVSGRLTSEGREKNLSHASHLASGCFLAIIHIV